MANETTKSYQTTKLTAAQIKAATEAVEKYERAAAGYYNDLTGEMSKLMSKDVFSGDAATGFKSFFDSNVVPTLGENGSLSAVNKGIKDILDGVKTTLLDNVDPGLKDFNQNPSAGEN